jgi:hypothetical protein
VRKMGMSEDYEGCVIPIRSDISTFSRGTGRSEAYIWHQNSNCPPTQTGGRFLPPNAT